MSKMNEDEWQNLYENFETTWMLTAVDHIDLLRTHLGDGEYAKPPEIRTDMLKMHGMAMELVNQGWTGQANDLFGMADDMEMQVSEMMKSLEYIQSILLKLTTLFPTSLLDDID